MRQITHCAAFLHQRLNHLVTLNRIILISAIILSVCVFACLTSLDQKYPYCAHKDLNFLPSGKIVKTASVGYEAMVADLLWIRALGYFGGHSQAEKNFTWLGHLLDVVTDLDPMYQSPYEFGGIVLAAYSDDVDASIALLKKGLINVPQDHPRYYYLLFFLAFDYMYHKADALTAARYLEQASAFPQSPDYLPDLAARLYAKANCLENAEIFLRQMILSTDRRDLKEQLQQRLDQVIHQGHIEMLTRALDRFRHKFGKCPYALNELLENKIIEQIPRDPAGGAYYLRLKDCTVQSTVVHTDALKLNIRKGRKFQGHMDDLPLPMRVPQYE